MSDHLPECFLYGIGFPVGEDGCICDRLRQAEQRGMSESAVIWATQGREQFDLGYSAGVAAARDAVAAAFPADQATYRWRAIAAIDAVRETPCP